MKMIAITVLVLPYKGNASYFEEISKCKSQILILQMDWNKITATFTIRSENGFVSLCY